MPKDRKTIAQEDLQSRIDKVIDMLERFELEVAAIHNSMPIAPPRWGVVKSSWWMSDGDGGKAIFDNYSHSEGMRQSKLKGEKVSRIWQCFEQRLNILRHYHESRLH